MSLVYHVSLDYFRVASDFPWQIQSTDSNGTILGGEWGTRPHCQRIGVKRDKQFG